MNERIKELAEQAIQETAKQGFQSGIAMSFDALERFAELIRADERKQIKQEQQACYVDSNKYRCQK